MVTVVLVIHILIAIALVSTVLIQRSEGGGLGIGGGGGGLMTGRAGANLLTRTTQWLAAGFFATSLALAMLSTGSSRPRSIMETTSPAPESTAPATPAEPSVPLAR